MNPTDYDDPQLTQPRPAGLATLYAGQLILVRYGSRGSQTAQVWEDCRPHEMTVRVRKFRLNSRTWTRRPTRIHRQDILSNRMVDPIALAAL